MNVQQRDAIDDAATELVRRAVDVVFVAVNDFVDADVGRFRRDDRGAYWDGRGVLKKLPARDDHIEVPE